MIARLAYHGHGKPASPIVATGERDYATQARSGDRPGRYDRAGADASLADAGTYTKRMDSEN